MGSKTEPKTEPKKGSKNSESKGGTLEVFCDFDHFEKWAIYHCFATQKYFEWETSNKNGRQLFFVKIIIVESFKF